MKIILIAENSHYKDLIGKTYDDLLVYYHKHSKHTIYLIYTDDYLKYNKSWFIDKDTDIIVFLDTDILGRQAERFKYVFELNCKIFASSLDLFYFENCRNCQWIQKCSGILHFGKATKLLRSYQEYFPNKIVKSFKGRFINSNRYKNYKLPKSYDILMFGSRRGLNNIEEHYADKDYKKKWEEHNKKILPSQHQFYPLRYRLVDLLLKNKDRYRIHILPIACIFNAKIANEELSKLINKSWLTCSSCSRADIPFAKYFEIAGSYSGILGNIPTDYNNLFKNNIVEITEWMTDDEILSTIDKALEDKEKLQEMINKLGDRIHEEYNLDAGIKDMDNVFDEIKKT